MGHICTHDFAHLEHITYESCMHVLVWLRTYVQEKSALRQEVVQVQLSYSLSRWRFENRKHILSWSLKNSHSSWRHPRAPCFVIGRHFLKTPSKFSRPCVCCLVKIMSMLIWSHTILDTQILQISIFCYSDLFELHGYYLDFQTSIFLILIYDCFDVP